MIEIGNFDSFYSSGRVFNVADVIALTEATRRLLPSIPLSVTIPHTLSLEEQIQLAQVHFFLPILPIVLMCAMCHMCTMNVVSCILLQLVVNNYESIEIHVSHIFWIRCWKRRMVWIYCKRRVNTLLKCQVWEFR